MLIVFILIIILDFIASGFYILDFYVLWFNQDTLVEMLQVNEGDPSDELKGEFREIDDQTRSIPPMIMFLGTSKVFLLLIFNVALIYIYYVAAWKVCRENRKVVLKITDVNTRRKSVRSSGTSNNEFWFNSQMTPTPKIKNSEKKMKESRKKLTSHDQPRDETELPKMHTIYHIEQTQKSSDYPRKSTEQNRKSNRVLIYETQFENAAKKSQREVKTKEKEKNFKRNNSKKDENERDSPPPLPTSPPPKLEEDEEERKTSSFKFWQKPRNRETVIITSKASAKGSSIDVEPEVNEESEMRDLNISYSYEPPIDYVLDEIMENQKNDKKSIKAEDHSANKIYFAKPKVRDRKIGGVKSAAKGSSIEISSNIHEETEQNVNVSYNYEPSSAIDFVLEEFDKYDKEKEIKDEPKRNSSLVSDGQLPRAKLVYQKHPSQEEIPLPIPPSFKNKRTHNTKF